MIDAPSAALTINGIVGAAGAASVASIVINGGSSFHCDSALYIDGARYAITSWTEL